MLGDYLNKKLLSDPQPGLVLETVAAGDTGYQGPQVRVLLLRAFLSQGLTGWPPGWLAVRSANFPRRRHLSASLKWPWLPKRAAEGLGSPGWHSPGGEVSLAHGATPQDLSPIHQPLLLGAGELGGKALLRGPGGGPRKPPGPTEHVTRVAKAPASPRRRREGRPGEGLEPDGEGLGGRGRLRAPAGLLQNRVVGPRRDSPGARYPTLPGGPRPPRRTWRGNAGSGGSSPSGFRSARAARSSSAHGPADSPPPPRRVSARLLGKGGQAQREGFGPPGGGRGAGAPDTARLGDTEPPSRPPAPGLTRPPAEASGGSASAAASASPPSAPGPHVRRK